VELRGLGKRGVLQPTDLALRPGEIVGLAGLLGSGPHRAGATAVRLQRRTRASCACRAKSARVDTPAEAVAWAWR
jgi:monosaccharide-transporting ATPase